MKTKKTQQPKHILMQFSGFMDPLMVGNANWENVTTKRNSQCYSTYSLNLFKVRLAPVSSAAAKTKGFGDRSERKGKTTFFFLFNWSFRERGSLSRCDLRDRESKGSVQGTDNRK